MIIRISVHKQAADDRKPLIKSCILKPNYLIRIYLTPARYSALSFYSISIITWEK